MGIVPVDVEKMRMSIEGSVCPYARSLADVPSMSEKCRFVGQKFRSDAQVV
jgi:hypothetical protein